MTCLKNAMETLSPLMPNTLKLVLKIVSKCSYGDCKNDDLERGLCFLLSSPGAYYCNVPEQRSIDSLSLGLNRPLKRSSVAWHYHNTPTNCLKQYSTHFITAIIFRGFFERKAHLGSASASRAGEGNWVEVCMVAWGAVLRRPSRKDGWLNFFLLSQRPFWPRRFPDKYMKPVFREIRARERPPHLSPCTYLPLPSSCTNKQARKSTPVGFSADAGCNGNGVSHSHALDQRSRFMGGAWRAQWCSVCHHEDFQ